MRERRFMKEQVLDAVTRVETARLRPEAPSTSVFGAQNRQHAWPFA